MENQAIHLLPVNTKHLLSKHSLPRRCIEHWCPNRPQMYSDCYGRSWLSLHLRAPTLFMHHLLLHAAAGHSECPTVLLLHLQAGKAAIVLHTPVSMPYHDSTMSETWFYFRLSLPNHFPQCLFCSQHLKLFGGGHPTPSPTQGCLESQQERELRVSTTWKITHHHGPVFSEQGLQDPTTSCC